MTNTNKDKKLSITARFWGLLHRLVSWPSIAIKARNDQKDKYLYNMGYDWAAGAILRGEETPRSIDVKIWGPTRNTFDCGAEMATHKLIRLGVIEDDS